MKGLEAPSRSPRTLFTFNSEQDIKQIATGCDADIGGTSTVHFELNKNAKDNAEIGKEATGVFWGDMRLGVKAGLESKVNGGYAGFRNKVRSAYSQTGGKVNLTYKTTNRDDLRCLENSQMTFQIIVTSHFAFV